MDAYPERGVAPPQQCVVALCLYVLWCSLAWCSHALGQTLMPAETSALLLPGIIATNLLFLVVAQSTSLHRPPDSTIALAQSVLGIVWTTLYLFLSEGPAELAVGMYITAILFAVNRLKPRALFHLASFAAIAYASMAGLKWLIDGGPVWTPATQFMIFAGVTAWALILARQPGHANAFASLTRGDYATKSYNQRYIMESLAREKGRTDRSNMPFSICIFDIDRFSAIADEHGSALSERVLKHFFQCVRQELRTMDSINPTGIERVFGRFSHEEFVAILPNTGLAGAVSCAERIIARATDEQYEHAQALSLSAGAAEYHRPEKLSELLSRAERALHKAMKVGHNQVQPRHSQNLRNAEIVEWRQRS